MGNVIENYAGEISMIREATLNGTQTGTALTLRGKVTFSYQPVLDNGMQRVNVWRMPSSDSFKTIFYQGSISGVYSHDSAILIFLESLLGLFSTQTNTPSTGLTTYSFRPHRLEPRKSLAIGLAYNPGTPSDPLNVIFTGAMIEQIAFTVRSRELVKWRVDFKAVGRTQAAKLTPTQNNFQMLRSLDATASLNATPLDKSFEISCAITSRLSPRQFNSSKQPTKLQTVGAYALTGEVAEYFNSDTIPAAVRNQTEQALQLDILLPTSSQKISIIWPRVIFRGGTPEGIAPGDLTCRASFEGMNDDGLGGTEPKIVAVL